MSRRLKEARAGVVAVIPAMFLLGCESTTEPEAEVESAPVLNFADLSEAGTASIERSAGGVSFELETSGLIAGNAYTIWVVTFNDTDGCTEGTPGASLCGPGDVVNAAARPDMMLGTGKVVNGTSATFSGTLSAGASAASANAPVGLPAHGIENPLGAEFHLVVHDHGPEMAAFMPDMISSIDGGCTDAGVPAAGAPSPWNDNAVFGTRGPNTCASVQFSLHPPS